MKVLNLCFSDMAGSAYTLSHALNKHGYTSINLRSTTNYVEYPAIAEMRDYNAPTCRRIAEKSDVILFHSYVRPFYEGLGLRAKTLQDKKKILYFHGSDLRYTGDEVLEQADKYIEDYQIVVSTPDLLFYAPKTAKWLPVARSFTEIRRQYSVCKRDAKALRSFGIPPKTITLCHAPTDESKKGSNSIYKACTKIVKTVPNTEFMTIRNQPWDACLRKLSTADIYFGQDPPFLGSYGMLEVESSIFQKAVITKMTREVTQVIKRETGLDNPFISFTDVDDLTAKAFRLVEDESLRKMFGDGCYKYCKAVHDEAPVVDQFNQILEGMN